MGGVAGVGGVSAAGMARAHDAARSLLSSTSVPSGYHLHVHSSGIEVCFPWPAYFQNGFDKANDIADAAITHFRRRRGSGPLKGAVLEPVGGEPFAVRSSHRRLLPHRARIDGKRQRVDQVQLSGMLRWPDKSVTFVHVDYHTPHRCVSFRATSDDCRWRCSGCRQPARKRDLKAAGLLSPSPAVSP